MSLAFILFLLVLGLVAYALYLGSPWIAGVLVLSVGGVILHSPMHIGLKSWTDAYPPLIPSPHSGAPYLQRWEGAYLELEKSTYPALGLHDIEGARGTPGGGVGLHEISMGWVSSVLPEALDALW